MVTLIASAMLQHTDIVSMMSRNVTRRLKSRPEMRMGTRMRLETRPKLETETDATPSTQ